jgi:hypothetical protein
MFTSPFGSRLHFRTALSLAECERRIDALTPLSFVDINFGHDPVSVRRRHRFWLYENSLGVPPIVKGRLARNMGWTEISGRGGSNLTSLMTATLTFTLLAALGVYEVVVEDASAGRMLLLMSLPASAFMYWRFWQNPQAGQLIDYLQQLLEAEPLPALQFISRR